METPETENTLTIHREVENAEAAMEESIENGVTERRCLRCGNKLNFYVADSGYGIWCETENCFKMTLRGI